MHCLVRCTDKFWQRIDVTRVLRVYTIHPVVHRRRIKTEEKAKFITVVLGDVLECHLAARMIFKNVFGRKITFGRVVVWYGV